MSDSSPVSRRARAFAFTAAPPRRQRRTWLDRQRSSRRGRVELGVMSGGVVALTLAIALPGLSAGGALAALIGAGLMMTGVGVIVGFIPSLAAAAFAPLVIALSDPMWALGETAVDFTLAGESWSTFIVFVVAAVAGAAVREVMKRRKYASRRRRAAKQLT